MVNYSNIYFSPSTLVCSDSGQCPESTCLRSGIDTRFGSLRHVCPLDSSARKAVQSSQAGRSMRPRCGCKSHHCYIYTCRRSPKTWFNSHKKLCCEIQACLNTKYAVLLHLGSVDSKNTNACQKINRNAHESQHPLLNGDMAAKLSRENYFQEYAAQVQFKFWTEKVNNAV